MTEHAEQCALFDWADVMVRTDQMPELENLYAIPNGGHRHKTTAAKLKAEGVKAGVLDVHLPVARRGYHSAYLEMKFGKNKLTPAQKDWKRRLEAENNYVGVCYSTEEAIAELTWYLGYG